MAAFTVIHGKGNREMADTAELSLQYPFHGKVLGGLLFDVEDIWVAIVAVKPVDMFLMGKDRRRDHGPFGFEKERLYDRHVYRRLDREIGCRTDLALVQGLHPINAIAELRDREVLCSLRKGLGARCNISNVTFFAVRLIMAEGCFAVVTFVRAAVQPFAVCGLGYLCRVGQHVELDLKMTDAAGELLAVAPMRESDRTHIVAIRFPVDQNIPVFFRRW